MPPPWISNVSPRMFSAIAEHSMCQPGRPRPHGEFQDVSSPSFFAFQSAKSRGSSFFSSGSSSPNCRSSASGSSVSSIARGAGASSSSTAVLVGGLGLELGVLLDLAVLASSASSSSSSSGGSQRPESFP